MLRKLGTFGKLFLLYVLLDFLAGYAGIFPEPQILAGQTVPANPVTTQQISMPVFTLVPAPATGATIQLVGNPGPASLYYWVVVNYSVGSASPAGPFTIFTAPNTLSGSNYVTVLPNIPAGATSYDLLKTSTPKAPTSACSCAVATAVSPTAATNDQSNSTGAYTVNPTNLSALGMTLQNEVQSAGVSHLILRQNGVFVADLSVGGGGGNPAFSVITSGDNTGATMTVDTGASLTPLNFGGIANDASFLINADAQAPTFVRNLTGGSLLSADVHQVAIVFNSALGPTRISVATQTPSTDNCVSGSSCSITVTPPTIPAPFTTYTVYAADLTISQTLQKIASCTNVTGACSFGSIPNTSSPPATNVNVPIPSGSVTNFCPTGTTGTMTPDAYLQRTDGTWGSVSGIDEVTGTGVLPTPFGTYTLCHRLFLNDTGKLPIWIKNTVFSIYHTWGAGTTTTQNADDRGMGVRVDMPATTTGSYPNSRPMIMYSELGLYGSPTVFGGGPDSGQGSKWVIDDERNGGNLTTMTYANWFDYQNNTSGGAQMSSNFVNIAAVRATITNNVPPTWNAGNVASIYTDNNGGGNAGAYVGIASKLSARWPANIGILFDSSTWTNAADFMIDARGTAPSRVRGPLQLASLAENAAGIPITSTISTVGGTATSQMATPAFTGLNASAQGTTGATVYTYAILAKDFAGGNVASGTFNVNNGNATLNGTNFNTIQISTVSFCSEGAASFDIYRTASGGTPSSTGKIGTFTSTDCTSTLTTNQFNDTGLAADGTTLPASNTSGAILAAGFVNGTNTAKQTGANFTTSSASLVTWKSLALPAVANYSLHCDLIYQQATTAAGLTLGIQTTPTAPTSMMAHARIYTTLTGTVTDATITVTDNASHNVLVGAAPASTGVNYEAQMDVTIENAAQGNALNIMAATANASDQITILRGSYCAVQP